MFRGEETTSSGILRSRQPRSSQTDIIPRLEITLPDTTNMLSSQILPKDLFDVYHLSHSGVNGLHARHGGKLLMSLRKEHHFDNVT